MNRNRLGVFFRLLPRLLVQLLVVVKVGLYPLAHDPGQSDIEVLGYIEIGEVPFEGTVGHVLTLDFQSAWLSILLVHVDKIQIFRVF